ncbi:amyloid protein-binding protein 2 [Zeugodacus cucurbitae]|uniref:amyloid protein-binding protein 2 n=1 Tax=Zeugodacus cucurbitae TaxID=28588 RepID=UPI0023D94E45|nr:amyloid protein-binding protein 2 [Zeugodacus cucurbitae]
MAEQTFKSPATLYKQSLDSFMKYLTNDYIVVKEDEPLALTVKFIPPSLKEMWKFEFMPTTLVAEILYEMTMTDEFNELVMKQLDNLNILDSLLQDERSTSKLFMCLTFANNKSPAYMKKLPASFALHWHKPAGLRRSLYSELVKFGLRLGSFLCENGFMQESIKVLTFVAEKISLMAESDSKTIQYLDCLQRRLYCETSIWDTYAASRTLEKIGEILGESDYEYLPDTLTVQIFTQTSAFHLTRHKFEKAYEFSTMAMQYLSESMPKRIVVDALRNTAKACMAVREYRTACMLIKQAISMAENVFGRNHLKYADVMFDYAYFLLIYDKVERAVEIYTEVNKIRLNKLPRDSFLMGLTKAALANAYYLQKHRSNGLVDSAFEVLSKELSITNLLLASVFRLKSLVKSEVAFDKYRRYYKTKKYDFKKYLNVQIESLNLCVSFEGEQNLLTAKNYFELARLYQASKQYQDAKRSIAKCVWITMTEMGSSEKDAQDLRVLENYLEKTNEERDILLKVQKEPLFLNIIEASDRALEEESTASPRFYDGLIDLYPPDKDYHKQLTAIATTQGWKTSSEGSNDFWCIEFLKATYFHESDTDSESD